MGLGKKIAIGLPALYFILAVSPLPWKGPINFPDAKISKKGNVFVIELTGRRVGMVHDPVSLVIAPIYQSTYVETETIIIPRDQGAIEGKEIPVKKGYYKYAGNIHISGTQMQLNLDYDDTDAQRLKPTGWNGTYRLQKTYQ